MTLNHDGPRGSTVSPRVALLSILCFWLVYFAVATIRSLMIDWGHQTEMLAARAFVTGGSMVATYIVYLAMRPLAGKSLAANVTAVALLAIPAAVAYSSMNWMAFQQVEKKIAAEKAREAENREPSPGTVMIQVGQPADRHKEKELTVLGQIGDQALNGYFFFAAWGALFLALSYAAAVRTAEREAAGYRAAARDAELRALRYQVNPHFLFNTLNSLSTLILKDRRDDAESMILNLSTFFRTSLTADPTDDVVLSEEIRLQRLYLDIEAVRFPDRLNVEIMVPPALNDARVPCLILQPLVENAIKYAVSQAKRPVTIRITAREDSHRLVLGVEDDGDPAVDGAQPHGTGVGLRNVMDRLKARFGEAAACRYGALANGGFGVTLFMPLIRHGV